MSKLTYFTTHGGIRGVHLHIPRASVAYTGMAVRAGSRDESRDDMYGLAHFVEHTIFKGTARRSSWHIINRMERVGGELNAFTGKEDTVIYAAFPRANVARAVELIADLTSSSRFPQSELDKERQVVEDEIDSYLDTPADAVFDDFEDLLFDGSSLGHNILGTSKALAGFTSGRCREWLDCYYTRRRSVIFYAGPMGPESFSTLASRYYDILPEGEEYLLGTPVVTGIHFDVVRNIDSHQAHTVMGVSLPRLDGVERITLALLVNILGGPGMNSVLNLELRERRGLVYNVEASASNFSDCSMFTVYFGCDDDDVDICRKLVTDTIMTYAESPLPDRRLAAAKKQYLGQLILAEENIENRIISYARSALLFGQPISPDAVHEMIMSITPSQLSSFATRLLPLSVLTLASGEKSK